MAKIVNYNQNYTKTKNEVETLLFVDIETTGLDFKSDCIVEIAGLIVQYDAIENSYKCISSFESLINRDRVLDGKIVELTSISQVQLNQAKNIIEVQEEWADWLELELKKIENNNNNENKKDSIVYIIGHSVDVFDLVFLNNEGFYLPEGYKTIDTNILSRSCLPFLVAHNLEFLARNLNLKVSNQITSIYNLDESFLVHRAFYDVAINFSLFNYLTIHLSSIKLSNFVISKIEDLFLAGLKLKFLGFRSDEKFELVNENKELNKSVNVLIKDGICNFNQKNDLLSVFLLHLTKVELDEFFTFYFDSPIGKAEILHSNIFTVADLNKAILQLYIINDYTKYNETLHLKLAKLSINPLLQNLIYLLLEPFLPNEQVYNKNSFVIESLINNYDFIFSQYLDIAQILDILYILSSFYTELRSDTDYILCYSRLKFSFEKNSNYGFLALPNGLSLTNNGYGLEMNLFIDSYNNFFKSLISVFDVVCRINSQAATDFKGVKHIDKFIQILQTKLIQQLNWIKSKTLDDKLFIKVNSTSLFIFYPIKEVNFLQAIKDMNVKLATFLNSQEIANLIAAWGLEVDLTNVSFLTSNETELKYNKANYLNGDLDVESIVSIVKKEIERTENEFTNCSDEINVDENNSENSSPIILVFNSHKVFKQFEAYVSGYANSADVFNGNIFITGVHGSFTKGLSKLSEKGISIFCIKLKEFELFISLKNKSNIFSYEKVFFCGNFAINFSPFWKLNKAFTVTKEMCFKSYVLSCLN